MPGVTSPHSAGRGALHRTVSGLATAVAVLGGIVLAALVILVCVSILGRTGNSVLHAHWLTALAPALSQRLLDAGVGPVDGDFELVEAGIAFAIFSFLPICQLRGGHATVDVFTGLLPTRSRHAVVAFWELVLGAVTVLICWRLYAGMRGKMSTGETTFLLQFPVWWAYAASVAAAAVAVVVAAYCARERLRTLRTGVDALADERGPGTTSEAGQA